MAGLEKITLNDRYFLKKLVGVGGMAQVYLAWDRLRSIDVAIKVPHDVQFFMPFINEAVALKVLSHENIIRFYDAEMDDQKGVIFFVMQWVDGMDLQKFLKNRRGPLGVGEVTHIFSGVHSALHYAHELEVIHCDIKPANIMLRDADSQVLLGDFGLASLAHHKGSGGTVAYMAPEQFTGSEVNRTTDIYSLGVALYQLLSGQLPFIGERSKIIYAHINTPPPPMQRFNPQLPKRIVSVIEKALAKNMHRRYSSITEFWVEFEKAIPGTGGSPPSNQSSLLGLKGEKTDKKIKISSQGITIGRNKKNRLRLKHPSISRFHATISCNQDGYTIRDNGSTVGTYVNGHRVPPHKPRPLRNGDKIRLGTSEVFEFRLR